MNIKKNTSIHFVGIGGVGMSGIAEVLLNMGYRVSGSDIKKTDITERLKQLNAKITYKHLETNVVGADVVVISSAIPKDNPDVVSASKLSIPIIPRAEMLAELMRLKSGIAIGGCHGKTTTTSMTAFILTNAGMDPTVVIGGKLNVLESGARLGYGEFIVAEADESDGSFLHLSPTIAVVTNIDTDHLDYYGSIEKTEELFLQFIKKVPFYGFCVLCADDARVAGLASKVSKRCITYGIEKNAEFIAKDIKLEDFSNSFEVFRSGKHIGRFIVGVPGRHNVLNALAALSVSFELEVPIEKAKEALASFDGVQRRFQVKGEFKGALVIDDYAHHPQEIKATFDTAVNLKRIKEGGKVLAIFQPHRYTRTKLLHSEFGKAFDKANSVAILPIYPAGEKPINGVSSQLIINSLKKSGHQDAVYIERKEDVKKFLESRCGFSDVVLFMGAGDVWKIANELV